MKIRLDLDLDIELTESGKKIQFSELWETAQHVAANAVTNVIQDVEAKTKDARPNPAAPDPKNEQTQPTDSQPHVDSSHKHPRPRSQVVSGTLHPLGTFLFEMLDRIAEESQPAQDNTFDDLKRGGPR